MTWGRTLENALKSKGISKDFDEWIAIAKDRSKWRQLTHSIPKPPDDSSGYVYAVDFLSRWRALRGFRKTLEDDHD